MTDPEKDRPLGVKTAPKPPEGASPMGTSSPVPPVPAEPPPAENRRLPKASARPAPVLALLRARWPWLVVTTLLGTLAGLALGATPVWQSTATLGLSGISDSTRVKQVGQTYQALVSSPPVITLAAKALNDRKPGIVGLNTITAEQLGPKVTGLWQTDTDLITITVKDPNQNWAAAEADAVADAMTTYVANSRDLVLAAITKEIKTQITTGRLDGVTADDARVTALGTQAGQAQISAILDAASLTVQSPTDGRVDPAGASRPVSAGLGGVGGLLVGALLALMAGAGRRRLRSPAELRSLAPELNLRATTQAGEVAGRLLESGHSTLVVLSLPSTPSSASRFAAAVANHLRTHGSSVTLVNAIALESGDSSAMSLPDEVWVLRRDIRQDVKSYFSTDVLVVACTAEPEAVGLISGQSDLMAVVVAKEGRSTLQQVWDTVSAVESADPIVVLAP